VCVCVEWRCMNEGDLQRARVHHRIKLKAFLSHPLCRQQQCAKRTNFVQIESLCPSDKSSCKLHSRGFASSLMHVTILVICWCTCDVKAAGIHNMQWQMHTAKFCQCADNDVEKAQLLVCDYANGVASASIQHMYLS